MSREEVTTSTATSELLEGLKYDNLMEVVRKFNRYNDVPQIKSYKCHLITFKYIAERFKPIVWVLQPNMVAIFGIPVYECEKCGTHYEESRPRECVCKCEYFIYHASKKEFIRWRQLQLMEKGKAITGLRRQVSMPVKVNGIPVFKYVADAVYYKKEKQIVEDSKGMSTDVFKLKKKIIEAYYGIEITIT